MWLPLRWCKHRQNYLRFRVHDRESLLDRNVRKKRCQTPTTPLSPPRSARKTHCARRVPSAGKRFPDRPQKPPRDRSDPRAALLAAKKIRCLRPRHKMLRPPLAVYAVHPELSVLGRHLQFPIPCANLIAAKFQPPSPSALEPKSATRGGQVFAQSTLCRNQGRERVAIPQQPDHIVGQVPRSGYVNDPTSVSSFRQACH